MPDPVLYLRAMTVAAVASTLCVVVCGGLRRPVPQRPVSHRGSAWIGLLALAVGLLLGYQQIRYRSAWPPVNALGRLLLAVVPATFAMELAAGLLRCSAWSTWGLRFVLSAAVGRILLHDSVYLAQRSDSSSGGMDWQIVGWLALAAGLLASVWCALVWMSRRPPGIAVPLAVAESMLSAGACIMLAGYVTGGAAALPFSAALVATCLTLYCTAGSASLAGTASLEGSVSVGVVGLFGLLFVGRFFGALTTTQAVVLLLAPLLCAATEVRPLSWMSDRRQVFVRLILVAVPLLVVVFLARVNFNRRLRPLVGHPLTSSQGQTLVEMRLHKVLPTWRGVAMHVKTSLARGGNSGCHSPALFLEFRPIRRSGVFRSAT